MESFVVSARKYRPTIFANVVSQTHITTTLKNAIKNNQLAQAFLFCGPRGVGKTTCARILAKTINCQQLTQEIEPCNACASCKSFNSNSSLNIHELDAASNNSVEDIRQLVTQVRYAPQVGKYKVYIIDEVHMLSSTAFNAFLKTLEEPPSYAIFILATTEKHKIIPTILSRCQIFDFNRIQPQAIAQQLKAIAQQEGIAYEEEAIHLISQKADGALRDALSIFDLIVTFGSGKKLTYQDILDNLHILDYDYYFKITQALLDGNRADILLIYNEILDAGFDDHDFIVGLSEHFRSLMVCKDAATLKLLEVTDTVRDKYKAQATHAPLSFLLEALHLANQCDIHYKYSKNKRLHVEITLMKMMQHGTHLQATETKKKVSPKAHQPLSKDTQSAAQPHDKIVPLAKQESSKKPITQETPSIARNSILPVTTKIPQLEHLKKDIGNETTIEPTQTVAQESVATKQSFTKEELLKHWKAYAHQLKAAGKLSEYSILNQTIELEGTTILLTFTNPVQQDVLEGNKAALLAFLREKLQNTNIDIKTSLVKEEHSKVPYTAKEKFDYLAKKYPPLLVLQKRLALEVDY
ncbi:MAG: DNA polymerase III subunit gamma/tau [Cytophagales bacterium]|nr:DNA polymerase III subunit gamma/tau [Cytophagales bacterium]